MAADVEMLRKLADSAEKRAHGYHAKAMADDREWDAMWPEHSDTYHAYMNDYFYWIGHVIAYRGIIAMIELQAVVEDERDAESTCP